MHMAVELLNIKSLFRPDGWSQDIKQKIKYQIDMLHQNMVLDSMRQSKRDERRKSQHSGLCDRTKVTAMERLGNLHELLVMSYTTTG